MAAHAGRQNQHVYAAIGFGGASPRRETVGRFCETPNQQSLLKQTAYNRSVTRTHLINGGAEFWSRHVGSKTRRRSIATVLVTEEQPRKLSGLRRRRSPPQRSTRDLL